MKLLIIIGGTIIVLCLIVLALSRRAKMIKARETRKFNPSQEAVDAVKIEPVKVPATPSMPLARNPRFVYYIAGSAAGLTAETYDRIDLKLKFAGLQLAYIPSVLQGLTEESLRFNFPGVEVSEEEINPDIFYRKAAEFLGITLTAGSRFLVSFCEKENCFLVYDATSQSEQEFITKLFAYAERFGINKAGDEDVIRFRITEDAEQRHDEFLKKYQDGEPMSADKRFEVEQEILVKQAKELIHKLLISDFDRDIIQSWLYEDIVISSLKVTAGYRIILPEYDNMEVKMTPLEKTVYLFFLKNPAGYAFKELPEHKSEIRRIYEKLARTGNPDEITKSIDDLTDPFGPSISEKCAHIKAKFISLMPEAIAKNYYISGEQGCAKRIPLDREKVEWEAEI